MLGHKETEFPASIWMLLMQWTIWGLYLIDVDQASLDSLSLFQICLFIQVNVFKQVEVLMYFNLISWTELI